MKPKLLNTTESSREYGVCIRNEEDRIIVNAHTPQGWRAAWAILRGRYVPQIKILEDEYEHQYTIEELFADYADVENDPRMKFSEVVGQLPLSKEERKKLAEGTLAVHGPVEDRLSKPNFDRRKSDEIVVATVDLSTLEIKRSDS